MTIPTPRATMTHHGSEEELDRLQVAMAPTVKRALKVAAVKRGETLSVVVERASREWLEREENAQK